jgi:hypothetical protein
MHRAFASQPPSFVAHSSTSAQLPGVPEYPGAQAHDPSELQTTCAASVPEPSQADWHVVDAHVAPSPE